MSDLAIRASKLRKVYTLYPSQWARVRALFGLTRTVAALPTHVAIDDIDLEVQFGEKVGFIGRNGAGKSTLLKLITGVIEPTSGRLEINGATHALLQMGAGFHQDFTGRQNAYAYLANFGLTGARADTVVQEVIEFSELEEYIDQPLKTYSTGMAMRLIFAASTTVAPQLLVVDEVLGVGDAYFQQKSFSRMQELCDTNRTTLLLVSHDIYSTARICDRIVWVDRGRIRFDGDPKSALTLYENSIKEQEEQRLAKRRMMAEANTSGKSGETRSNVLYGALRPLDATKEVPGFAVAELSVTWSGGRAEATPVLSETEGNWGEQATLAGRLSRPFRDYGSVFRKLPFLLRGEGLPTALANGEVHLCGEFYSKKPVQIQFSIAHPVTAHEYGGLFHLSGTGWESLKARADEIDATMPGTVVPSRYGTRHVEILGIGFLNENGEAIHVVPPLTPLRLRLRYRINDPDFCENPVVVIAFQKDGVVRSHRFSTKEFRLSAVEAVEGELEVTASPLLLGAGTYFVTASMFREDYFSPTSGQKFFSINDGILDMHARAYELQVSTDSGNPLMNDVIFLHPQAWHWRPTALGTSTAIGGRQESDICEKSDR